jgi:putative transposase
MARPVYLKGNNHTWRKDHNLPSIAVETTANEAYTDQSTASSGNVASVEIQDD